MSKKPQKTSPKRKSSATNPKNTKRKPLSKKLPFKRTLHNVIFGALVLIVGSAIVYMSIFNTNSDAVTVVKTVQGESFSWNPVSTAQTLSDSSASGGKTIKLSGNASGHITYNQTDPAKELRITARGDQCFGAPNMQVKLDGVDLGTASVSSGSWAQYRFPSTIAAGDHRIDISFTNQREVVWFWIFRICSSSLYVDKASTSVSLPDPAPPASAAPSPGSSTSPSPSPTVSATPSTPPVSSPVPSSAPSGNTSTQKPLLVGDYETNNLSQWAVCQMVSYNDPCSGYKTQTYRMQTQTSVVRQGKYAARFEVRDGDYPGFPSGERSEVNESGSVNGTVGSERWYQWSFQLANGFPVARDWQVYSQWHGYIDGSPPIAIGANSWFFPNGQWGIDVNSYTSSNTDTGRTEYAIWKTPQKTGVWNDIKLHIKWSPDPTVGFIEFWYNGVRQTFTGAPCANQTRCYVRTMIPGDRGVYFKQGLYRDNNSTTTGIIYEDGFSAATTEAGLQPL